MSTVFIENCKSLLNSNQAERFNQLYFEFIDGGDEMYGGKAPVDFEKWNKLSVDEKAALAEKILNQPNLKVAYPGTYSGPISNDLQLLKGLTGLKTLDIDSMQVTTYTTLLEVPNLEQITIDNYAHDSGYFEGLWSVFDALIFAEATPQENAYRRTLKDIPQYRKLLDLTKPFEVSTELPADWQAMDTDARKNHLNFITLDFLKQKFLSQKT